MLTLNSPNGRIYKPDATKLFKIDDRTIAAIAGLYSDEGLAGFGALDYFSPATMARAKELVAHMPQTRAGFAWRAYYVGYAFAFEMANYLNIRHASQPDADIPPASFLLEVTVAGYDNDGSLNVAEITLEPHQSLQSVSVDDTVSRPHSPSTAACQTSATTAQFKGDAEDILSNILVMKLGSSLFCDIAGTPGVAESLLSSPSALPNNPALLQYSGSLRSGSPLTLDQLRALGVTLEETTAREERRRGNFGVGGDLQIAELSEGMVTEEPPPRPATEEEARGAALATGIVTDIVNNCPNGAAPPIQTNLFIPMKVTLNHCTQPLDSTAFYDSTFNDSTLTYGGTEPLIFYATNHVVNSRLELAPTVDLKGQKVLALVCGFPWIAVTQGGTRVDVQKVCMGKPKSSSSSE
ncbi:MAG: hypothetical protein WA294_11610 [Acidobacteriaceae bacterium]